ncbi:MAG: carboxypeptidase-like regulatory domain-containing protein [Bacteroidota bacterium]
MIFLHYSRLSLLLFLLLCCSSTIAQITISGSVVDEKTGEVIPYVTVQLKSENKYSRTDEDGLFKIYPNKRTAMDTLVFSSIGYLQKKVAIAQLDNDLKVTMAPDVTQLKEVKISLREMTLGKYTKDANYKPMKGTSMVTHRFMKKDDYSYLKKVIIWRKPDRLYGKQKAKFRITIYNSEDNFGPPNGVVYEQILVDDTDQEELVVDLMKYNILLPTNYFFVGVERLDSKNKNLVPFVYVTPTAKYCWVKLFRKKEWRNAYALPAIVAVVM